MMRNLRIENSQKLLVETSRYQDVLRSRTPTAAPSQGVGIQLTAVVTIAIGLLSIACAVASGDGTTLVAGNPLAERIVIEHGMAALDPYRLATMALGLALTALGIRAAAIASRKTLRGPRLTPAAQAVLGGLVATNLSLLAWWTGWLFA